MKQEIYVIRFRIVKIKKIHKVFMNFKLKQFNSIIQDNLV